MGLAGRTPLKNLPPLNGSPQFSLSAKLLSLPRALLDPSALLAAQIDINTKKFISIHGGYEITPSLQPCPHTACRLGTHIPLGLGMKLFTSFLKPHLLQMQPPAHLATQAACQSCALPSTLAPPECSLRFKVLVCSGIGLVS